MNMVFSTTGLVIAELGAETGGLLGQIQNVKEIVFEINNQSTAILEK